MAVGLSAQNGGPLFSFDSTNGTSPLALVQGIDGNLYGTALTGGADYSGTLFSLTTAGVEATLYNFCTAGLNCLLLSGDPLVQAPNGDFYGTAWQGGAYGMGAIYKATPSGEVTTLYSFCAQKGCPDGQFPYSPLVRAVDGNFYGTTFYGGASPYCNGECGTIFKMTPGGQLTTVYSFCAQPGCTDGALPNSLIQASDGNFYGTADLGGVANCLGFLLCGTVFKFTAAGELTTLHAFCATDCRDGGQPNGLIESNEGGYFYGTASSGGVEKRGSVFRITPSGEFNTIYSFRCPNDCTDGRYPNSGLIQGTDGNLYGTTSSGGGSSASGGSIFGVTPRGELTTLYTFCTAYCYISGPVAGLVQATNGAFYGTIQGGGANGDGAVFTFSLGHSNFAKPQPAFAKVGKQVQILGTNLTGATSVTFNGTPAAFTVTSDTLIDTTVPPGATSGTIQVVTPGGTLASNVRFRVLP